MIEHAETTRVSPFTNAHEFKREQERLSRFWTLLGITEDVANDGDWFCATLGGRSIFVQRFGPAIKAFENRCAHRFYPLRTAKKGNGPIVCGFHHWRYDQDGRAIGIPMCQEMFGTTPRELDARLNPVEVAVCGSLIFGRFASERRAKRGDGKPETFDNSYTIQFATADEFRARLHEPDFLFIEKRIPKFEFPPCYVGA